jgi:hypothetical protein
LISFLFLQADHHCGRAGADEADDLEDDLGQVTGLHNEDSSTLPHCNARTQAR